jgi:mycothiol synthase
MPDPLLEPGQYSLLAEALGDTPDTVQATHLLRRGLGRAFVAGDPARFDAAIVQSTGWPEEPVGFGANPVALWRLLQRVEGWTCILVDTSCASLLGQIIGAKMAKQVRYLDDVTHTLARPVQRYRQAAVRLLSPADLDLLEAAPLELRAGLWHSPRQLLAEGTIACAVVDGEIVATALTAACSERYAEIGVYTREDHRGRGYATAAASLVAGAAQAARKIPVWGAGAHNEASLRVAKKLGFEAVSRRTYVILGEDQPYAQLQMVWPEHLLSAPPAVRLPPGYRLRTYRPGDEARFYEIMDLAGWPGWDDARLAPWIARVLPGGWFLAVHEARDEIVASAMAVHSHSAQHPFGGEIGWVAADPAHTGRGLGLAVSAAATARLIAAGYRNIHLYSEDWRLPALKTYLKLGYVPFLYAPGMAERWQAICAELAWPFTPEEWQVQGGA